MLAVQLGARQDRRGSLSAHVADLANKLAVPEPDRASVGMALSVVERQLRNLD